MCWQRGKTALDYAKENWYGDCVRLLESPAACRPASHGIAPHVVALKGTALNGTRARPKEARSAGLKATPELNGEAPPEPKGTAKGTDNVSSKLTHESSLSALL